MRMTRMVAVPLKAQQCSQAAAANIRALTGGKTPHEGRKCT